jgi:hypothetical protein
MPSPDGNGGCPGRTRWHLGATDKAGGFDPTGGRSPAKYSKRYPEAVHSLTREDAFFLGRQA